MNQSNKDIFDMFIANSIYPDSRSIFSRLQSLDEIKDDCFVVLDTNVLLAPYTIGKENLLDQCRKTYKPLSAQKRLIIPGQVAREFAKNRAAKITELYQQLSKKQVPSMFRGKYPLLNSLEKYKMIVTLEEEIDKKLDEYRLVYKKAINEMLSQIQDWRWNDPVTLLYSEIFDKETLMDPVINEEALKRDLEHRQMYSIPPAYKDRAKDDSGIGDLLIWYTILELGKNNKKGVIFVSGDGKADWCLRSEGHALFPRYELVDEFRRHSEGQAFHIVKFSHFLELFGASEKIVEEIRQEETLLQSSGRITSNSEVEATDAIIDWLQEKYFHEALIGPNPVSGPPDILIIEPTGNRIGVEIKIQLDFRAITNIINQLVPLAQRINESFNKAKIFILYNDFINAAQAANEIEHALISSIVHIPDNISFVIGHIQDNKFYFIDEFPHLRII